jgi:hypothetical protein
VTCALFTTYEKTKNVDVITIPNYAKIKIREPSTASNYTLKEGTLLKSKG